MDEIITMNYKIAIGENKYEVEIDAIKDGVAMVTVNGTPYEVNIENFLEVRGGGVPTPRSPIIPSPSAPSVAQVNPTRPPAPPAPPASGLCVVAAPIPGLVAEIKVCAGDRVAVGQVVAVIEAMKMLNNIQAKVSGTVREVRVGQGVEVSMDDIILIID
jgi:biotin carboxyl carrier protein